MNTSTDDDVDVGFQLLLRFFDVLRQSNPALFDLVDDYACRHIEVENRVIWFDFSFSGVPNEIKSEAVPDVPVVLNAIAKQCLGPAWRAVVYV